MVTIHRLLVFLLLPLFLFLLASAGIVAADTNASGATAPSKKDKAAELYEHWTRNFNDLPEISITEVKQMQKHHPETLVLVDVRDKKEQRVSMIPGAIPHRQFLKQVSRYQTATVVTYCTIGSRSGKFARKLRRKYQLDARNLRGSILGWTHEGGQLVSPDGQPTKRVHVYGEDWNFAADGYVPVW